jgi:hypothetical protein
MKATQNFKNTIQAYLQDRASNDSLFAVRFNNESKNIDDCVTFILNCVQKSGCNGFDDDEIFSMAVHYYDEDDIEIGNSSIKCHVSVNHVVELTQEDKDQAKEEAMKLCIQEEYNKLHKKAPVKAKEETKTVFTQQSLF